VTERRRTMTERGQDRGCAGIRLEHEREKQPGGGSSEGEKQRHEESKRSHTSTWEWIIAALGALVVLSAVTIMLYEAFSSPPTPPKIEVVVDSIVDTEYGRVVEFRVRNHGQQTAAGLVVEGELRSDTGTIETAQVTIDYVPAQSSRRGGLLFTHDPRRYALEVKGKGYDRP
jgi:uncharacterized protein (TIGR02588 family)